MCVKYPVVGIVPAVFRNNLNQNCRVCDFSTHVGVKLHVNGNYITKYSQSLAK